MSRRPAALVPFVCLLSACSDAGKPATPPAPTIVEYALGDFYFNGPDTIPAGPVAFRFKLTGAEPHVMNFIRLDQGKRMADAMAAGGSMFDSAWVAPAAGGVTITGGESPIYTFSLVPGRYLLLCYFHAQDGVPHFAKGMVKEVIVAGPITAAPPAEAVTQLEMVDYGYKMWPALPAGRQTIRVLNPTGQGHEVLIKRLADGVTLEAGRAWIDSTPPKGPSPWIAWGGVNMEPGDTVFMTADFPPGRYRLVCFYKLAGEEMNHAERGMDEYIVVN